MKKIYILTKDNIILGYFFTIEAARASISSAYTQVSVLDEPSNTADCWTSSSPILADSMITIQSVDCQ
jgi:hypothetical protein